VIYLATSPGEPAVSALLDRHRIGLMAQPGSNPPRAGWLWAADNGAFSDRFDPARWQRWLTRGQPRAGCLFAVVPDVVADAAATLDRFDEYVGVVRDARLPVALAAQDGLAVEAVPWREVDALFVGGSTAWKMGPAALDLARAARARGCWLHVGRINSGRRWRAWAPWADSCDGSLLSWGPATNVGRLTRMLDRHDENPQLLLT
jgi:hypothetical protein